MPHNRADLFLVTFQEEDISHHADIEDSRSLIPSARSQQDTIAGLEFRHGNRILMTM
jgi:hypothetical protein